MSNVAITGTGVKGQIEIDNASLFSKANLTTLVPKTQALVEDFNKPLGASKLNSISFDATYASPKIPLDATKALAIGVEVSPLLTIFRETESPLLGKDDFALDIPIESKEAWVGFQIGATVEVTGLGAAPNGVGIEIDQTTSGVFATYKRFDDSVALSDAIKATLSEFRVPANASELRAQKPGTVLTSDITGTVTVAGSWSIPGSVNTLALADTKVPIQIEVVAGSSVTLTGAIAISGKFVFRSWKKSDSELFIGLYKKKGTTFSVSFTAAAGMEADKGSADLIAKVFGLLSPAADTTVLGTDPGGIRAALKQSVDHSLAMCLNASCAAAVTDESAFFYTVDLEGNPAETDAALNAAIRGDWTKIAKVGKERKNVVGRTIASNHKMVVNVLGIYNYATIAEFISRCTVVHNAEDGSATITDVETAKRIAAASTPHQAAPDQLRHALSEAAISTAAYSFAKTGNASSLTSSQTLVIYRQSADARRLTKDLMPAVVLGMATQGQISSAIAETSHKHALIQFEQKIEDAAAGQMFLNPATGEPWQQSELVPIGIGQLRALLDPNDPEDKRRLEFLARWPQTQPPAPFVVDWLDITWWADAVANASAKYVTAKAAFAKIPPGVDASKDPEFMRARKDLAKALRDMSENEHSAFTPGWPLAVMHWIARRQSACSLNVSWDSRTQLQLPAKSATA